jgi:hypothetical protein
MLKGRAQILKSCVTLKTEPISNCPTSSPRQPLCVMEESLHESLYQSQGLVYNVCSAALSWENAS